MRLMVVIVIVLAAACKPPKKNDSMAGSTSAVPRRIGDSGTPVGFDVDEKTGRPKAALILRLDYFPEAKPGSATLPACYPPFAEDFALGVAACDDQPSSPVAVLAKNVEQHCYTDANLQHITAAQPLAFAGCRHATIRMHEFDPKLKLDADVKD